VQAEGGRGCSGLIMSLPLREQEPTTPTPSLRSTDNSLLSSMSLQHEQWAHAATNTTSGLWGPVIQSVGEACCLVLGLLGEFQDVGSRNGWVIGGGAMNSSICNAAVAALPRSCAVC
jgi:hypothetical protein